MKKMKFTQFPTDQVHTDDQRFRISPAFSVNSLIFSIKKAGLLNPPVLTRRDNKHIVVSGWRRITACQKLSLNRIPVFVMEEPSDLEAFKVPVYENLSVRDYSVVEKAAVLSKLHRFRESTDAIIKKYMPLFKLIPKRETFDVCLKIDRLSDNIKKMGHQKNWSFGILEIMTEMGDQDIKFLYPYISKLSLNKQKQLIESIFDIAKKLDISVRDVLNSGEFLKIKQDEKLNPLQKAEKIHEAARRQKYPTLDKWKQAFEKVSENLDLPDEMKVMPSKFFEDEVLTIKLDVKNKKELEKNIRKLKKLSEKKEISLLFNPFCHE